jgi:hypothetical protein
MDVIKSIIQKKQSNCKGLIVSETNVRDDVKLTTGNKKRNKCVNVLENFGFLEMKGGVFRNVNTLMEVRNMNEDFLAAAIVAEKSLQRLQEIIDRMIDEKIEPIEE